MFSDLLSLLFSKEVILLFLLLGGFTYLVLRDNVKTDRELIENLEETYEQNFNMILIISLIIFSSTFVLGILFSDKVIKSLMSVSQLASVGLFLNKIKSFFTGSSQKVEIVKEVQPIVMTGGAAMNLYDDVDEMPYSASDSSDDEEY